MRKLALNSQTMSTQIITAKTAKRSSEQGTYYAVEFTATDNKVERIQQLLEFTNSQGKELCVSRFADNNQEIQLAQLEELAPANNQEELINNSHLKLEDF